MRKVLSMAGCMLFAGLMLLSPQLNAEVIVGKDKDAMLPFWEWRDDEISLRLVQRLPDQTRAYFAGRGFKSKEVEFIASHCVFQTVYKNISPAGKPNTIHHNITAWRYHYKGKTYEVMPREDWKPLWHSRKVSQAQIVAFEWSLLPSKQVFQAGDYNWGMTFFSIPHGESFDLDITWLLNGKPRKTTLTNVQCAKDEYIPPQ